jgi:hypothetical protein
MGSWIARRYCIVARRKDYNSCRGDERAISLVDVLV